MTNHNDEQAPSSQGADVLKKITRLRTLLQTLPSLLPTQSCTEGSEKTRDNYSTFIGFQPDQDWYENTDDLPGAVTKVFKKVFGWNADKDKATTFLARGKEVEAIADALQEYSVHPDCQGNIGLLDIWIDRMIEMAEETHSHPPKAVSLLSQLPNTPLSRKADKKQ